MITEILFGGNTQALDEPMARMKRGRTGGERLREPVKKSVHDLPRELGGGLVVERFFFLWCRTKNIHLHGPPERGMFREQFGEQGQRLPCHNGQGSVGQNTGVVGRARTMVEIQQDGVGNPGVRTQRVGLFIRPCSMGQNVQQFFQPRWIVSASLQGLLKMPQQLGAG